LNFILVGVGGALGGLCRFKLGRLISQRSKTTYPIGTFLINITGAILLGMLMSINIGSKTYLILGEGFLGAYTTFSTFMFEGFNLFQENEKLNAFIYILGSLFIGIIGYVLGYEIAKLLITF